MTSILAAITMSNLVGTLIFLVCIGLVFWLLWWLVSYIGLPQPFDKVAGHPLITR